MAGDILALVKKFFEQSDFKDKPDAARKYVTWALAPGGPAYYAKPIPQAEPMAKGKGKKEKEQGNKVWQYSMFLFKSELRAQ